MATTQPAQIQEKPDRAAVLAELERITGSSAFGGSARLKRLLRFLVEEALAGRTDGLRGAEIATRFFERGEGFDSSIDSIVRVEMSKLRRALRACAPGPESVVRIELPLGTYLPRFVVLQPSPSPPSSGPPVSRVRQAWLPGGPTVTVRPFTCRDHGAAALALAHGLPEQIAGVLSRIAYLHTIAPSSDAAAEGYLLEGSVTSAAGTLQVTVVLREVDGRIVGGDTYVRPLSASGAVAIQQELSEIILAQLFDFVGGALIRAENLKVDRAGSGSPTHYQAILRFRRWFLTFEEAELAEARATAETVLQTHPNTNMVTMLSHLSEMYIMSGWTSAWSLASRPLALQYARRALMTDPLVLAPHLCMAVIYMDAGEGGGMRQAAERCVAIGTMPSLAGFLLAIAGEWERGTALVRRHLGILSYAPGWYHHALFLDAYRRGDYPAALDEAQLIGTPKLAWDPLDRAAALGKLGEVEAAQEAVTELLAILPRFAGDPQGHLRRLVPDRALVEELLAGLSVGGIVVR